ncbi:MAG TPA: Flp pilus assembly protein CpaB, partial [Bdellovibrionota bacterium]|nr:Flp pilus assembly protein CpaB [Bdellovibrionota bacterium]
MNKYRPFLISAILAGVAVLLASLYLRDKEQLLVDQSTAIDVLVAAKDINEMDVIDSEMIRTDKVPKKYLQPGAQTDVKAIEGLITAAPIKQGEQILDTKLLYPGAETGLSRRISNGRRAVTIPVTDVHGVGKLIRPGDRVDILASIDYGAQDREEREVKTIMQDILVLATGQHVADALPRAIATDWTGEE